MRRRAAVLALLVFCGAACAGAEVPLAGERVTLLVPPGEKDRPDLARLAAALDKAAAEMAPRVPLPPDASPVTIVVEPDYVAQGRSAGSLGEAVAGKRADLHLVYHPDDLPAYRHALARALLARAGLPAKLPVWLVRGAALWLSRDWYGRPSADWLPLLAAARVLPTPEQLLAASEAADASALLWTPAAAAVVERLPGKTVAEKLAQPPSRERLAELLAALAAAPPKPAVKPASRPRVPFLKGVSFAMLNRLEGGYHSPAIEPQLDVLGRLGANAVSLMPFAYQPGVDRPELRYLNRGTGSETDLGLVHAARRARARGFRVLYKPHLWVSRSWVGEIRMKSEADWALWWQGYRRYVLHHAFLARWTEADLFSVGVELSRTLDREAEWRDLIAAVRLFFPGPVTYSANWYGDLETVKFWDRLDLVGVDAYFPLAASPAAGQADLKKGAREAVARLEAVARRAGKPVLLTEVGFAARRGAWVSPHEEGGEYSEEDQAAAYEALLGALGRPRWLAGTFIWKAFSAAGAEGGQRADFRFLGRQAEEAVRAYYKR